MNDSDTFVIPVRLDSGSLVLAEVRPGDREEEVSWKDYQLSDVIESLKELLQDLVAPLSAFSCDKMALEIGVGLAVREGKLTSLLIGGSASASLKITMEWGRGEEPR